MHPQPLTDELPRHLAQLLKQPLPGPAAQARYQPELSYGRHFGPAPATARPAAVLVLLYPQAGRWHLPLTLRPAHLFDHPGQISLPGGTIEPGESSERAALRELSEELGVDATAVELLGELSPVYLFRNNFQIRPWVGVAGGVPAWRPNPAEVAELLEVPLAALCDPATTCNQRCVQGGVEFDAPSFLWRERAVWGATALILAELVALVDQARASH